MFIETNLEDVSKIKKILDQIKNDIFVEKLISKWNKILGREKSFKF